MIGLFSKYLQDGLFVIWCLLAAYFLFIVVCLIRDRIREAVILRKLMKDKNFKKLRDFASKIKLKVVVRIDRELSGLVYSKTVKSFFGKETEILLKKPFIVLGVKYEKSDETMSVALSHEIGHRLYCLIQIDKYGVYLDSPDILCPVKNTQCELIQEIGGWENALRILEYLEIGFDREKFLKCASFYFGTYLVANSNCLDQNCPKLLSILSNELTFGSVSLNKEERKIIVDYLNDVTKIIQVPDLGKIFND